MTLFGASSSKPFVVCTEPLQRGLGLDERVSTYEPDNRPLKNCALRPIAFGTLTLLEPS
jgi:hypothetical protein